MKKKVYLLLLLLIIPFTLISCDKQGEPGPITIVEADEKTPTAVSISGDYKVQIGNTIKLKALVAPEATASQVVTWSSSNDEVATVDENGQVTGKSVGNIIITATASYKLTTVSGTWQVEVYQSPTSITFAAPDELYVDDELTLIAQFTPVNAKNNVIWSSSNENVISIDENGVIVALTSGVSEIQVVSSFDSTIKYTKTITVKERSEAPTSLKVNVANKVQVGDTLPLAVTVTPNSAINTVTWTSSDPEVVLVDQTTNIATGIKEGTATLTATSTVDSNVKVSFVVTVVKSTTPDASLDIQEKIIEVIGNSLPSIIGVSNYKTTDGKLARSSIGSGAVYKSYFKMNDGSIIYDEKKVVNFDDVETYCYYVVTNRHVVVDSEAVKIYLPEIEEEVNAKLLQYDDKVDLAVVYFEYTEYIPVMKFADSDELKQGEFAIAIGNPEGYDYSWSSTLGIISYTKRYISDDTDDDGVNDWDAEYIQHDVAINPGNSGGPLVNLRGEIIGINTLKLSATSIEGMGFSIPSNVIVDLLPYLENGERPVRAKIGVTILSVKDILAGGGTDEYPIPDEIKYGLYVSQVTNGSVAFNGGILAGDIILTFNGKEIIDSIVLRAELGQIIVGSNEEIAVTVYRNGQIINLNLIF